MSIFSKWWEKYKEKVLDDREAKAAYDAAYKPVYKRKKIEEMQKKAVTDAARHAERHVRGTESEWKKFS